MRDEKIKALLAIPTEDSRLVSHLPVRIPFASGQAFFESIT